MVLEGDGEDLSDGKDKYDEDIAGREDYDFPEGGVKEVSEPCGENDSSVVGDEAVGVSRLEGILVFGFLLYLDYHAILALQRGERRRVGKFSAEDAICDGTRGID